MKTRSSPFYFLGVLSLALSPFAVASPDEPPPPKPATLVAQPLVGPLARAALENNPRLRAAALQTQAARRESDIAARLPNPRLQISAFLESVQTRTGPQRQALSLQQSLPGLGKRRLQSRVADAAAEALWHAHAAQQLEIVDQVAAHVLRIAYLDKAQQLTRDKTALLRRLESAVEDKVKTGGKLGDLLQIQIEIETTADTLARQDSEIQSARAQLAALVGATSPDATAAIPANWTAPEALESDVQAWIAHLENHAPEIAALRALERSAEGRKQIATLARRPDFTLGLTTIRTESRNDAAVPDNGKDPLALMLGVSLPIWGKSDSARIDQSQFEREAAAALTEARTLELVAAARDWIAKLRDAESRIQRLDTKILPLARQYREITLSNYRSDAATLTELIESDRSLLRFETQYWRAAADAWRARWKLATLSGGLWLE